MMTVDERNMAIAYADLLNIQELVQHISRTYSCQLFGDKACKALVEVEMSIDTILADSSRYMSEHTDFESGRSK